MLPVRVVAALALIGAALAAPAVQAASDEIRSLLRELWVQVPSRQVSAPPFSLADLNGTRMRLSDQSGRAVMLYFWITY